VGCPTPAVWIAQATAMAISRMDGHSGTWNLVAGGETSWHGFATAIFYDAACAGLVKRTPDIVPVLTSEYPTPARRPLYSRLDSARFARDFGVRLPDWRIGVNQVIAEVA